MISRSTLTFACVAVLLVSCTQAAFANTGTGTSCDASTETCTVTVSTPGSPNQSGSAPSPSEPADHTGSGGSGSDPVPTSTATLINGACTYQVDPGYQPPTGTDAHSGQKGAWYLMTCPDDIEAGRSIATTTTTVVWLPAAPTATAAPPAPAVLAAEAAKNLKLAKPLIETNPAPGQPQLVYVPMWSWLPSSVFAAASATASVPGESVTATATPVSVTWSWGDGSSSTCTGPGTPYTSTDSPTAASPTCGHTYTEASGSGDYTVSATIGWTVTWAGGGQTGAFNNLTTMASEQVRVEQSRALVTGG